MIAPGPVLLLLVSFVVGLVVLYYTVRWAVRDGIGDADKRRVGDARGSAGRQAEGPK
jgi:hypothetical protein